MNGQALWFPHFSVSVLLTSCPCICGRNKSKNNTWIFYKLSTQVETLKISDQFVDGQNPSSSSNLIAGYLLIFVRFSIEIYVKMLKYQLFRRQIFLNSEKSSMQLDISSFQKFYVCDEIGSSNFVAGC